MRRRRLRFTLTHGRASHANNPILVSAKRVYATPELEALGSIENVTRGNTPGQALDADFAAGTPKGDLTFS